MSQQPQTAGLTPSRLEQLCRPGQIEDTLRLLFALNHWAKARERLFFADRQGLYLVKAAIVRQAYLVDLVQARAYIDGREESGADLSFDLAADIASESFLWRLAEIADRFERERAERQEDTCDRLVHQLYTRITGRESISLDEVETLEIARVHEYILECLRDLEQQRSAPGRRDQERLRQLLQEETAIRQKVQADSVPACERPACRAYPPVSIPQSWRNPGGSPKNQGYATVTFCARSVPGSEAEYGLVDRNISELKKLVPFSTMLESRVRVPALVPHGESQAQAESPDGDALLQALSALPAATRVERVHLPPGEEQADIYTYHLLTSNARQLTTSTAQVVESAPSFRRSGWPTHVWVSFSFLESWH